MREAHDLNVSDEGEPSAREPLHSEYTKTTARIGCHGTPADYVPLVCGEPEVGAYPQSAYSFRLPMFPRIEAQKGIPKVGQGSRKYRVLRHLRGIRHDCGSDRAMQLECSST